GCISLEHETATPHEESRTPVALGVEEHDVDILTQVVQLKRALEARAERAVASLEEEPAGLPFGAPDVDVVAAVAVDVAEGQGGAFGRQEVWDQRLAVEIVEAVLPVREVDGEAVRHVGEQRH